MQAGVDDAPESLRQVAGRILQSGRRIAQDRRRHFQRRAATEGQFAGRHLVEDDAEGEYVGALVRLFAAQLFGRHVVEGADHRPGEGRSRLQRLAVVGRDQLGETEVQDFDLTVVGHHHVCRLQIPVGDAFGVRGGNRFGQRHRHPEQLCRRHAAGRDHLGEGATTHELHRDEVPIVGLFDGVDGDDVGMIQGGHRAGLLRETSAHRRVERELAGQELQSHRTLQLGIYGFVDFAPATLPEQAANGVAAQPVTLFEHRHLSVFTTAVRPWRFRPGRFSPAIDRAQTILA